MLTVLLFWDRATRQVRTHAQHVENIRRVNSILHRIRRMHRVMKMTVIEMIRNVRVAMSRWGRRVRGKEGGRVDRIRMVRRGVYVSRSGGVCGLRLLKLTVPKSRGEKITRLQIQGGTQP